MHLSEIWIYPIKSLGGIRLKESLVFEKGLQYDRRWMLVDKKGRFITQRTHHQMALFQVKLLEDSIQVGYPKYGAISFPITSIYSKSIQVSVWDDALTANLLNADINNWFSEILKEEVQLVKMDESDMRLVDEQYAHNAETVSFADGYPFLLISEASLADLNSKTETNMSMRRFRPSFVVSGFDAFQEDKIKEIQIGAITFLVVKPCSRCIMTTIDQETATTGKEPLLTLSKYRKVGNKIMFGQNLLAKNTGLISENNPITIIT